MKPTNANPPGPGVYRVFWESGGASLATIGVTRDGGRWIAPTNWILPAVIQEYEDPGGRGVAWGQIKRLEILAFPGAGQCPVWEGETA